MYNAECMKERYASVTPMLCLGNGYFMPTIHENRPYTSRFSVLLNVVVYDLSRDIYFCNFFLDNNRKTFFIIIG